MHSKTRPAATAPTAQQPKHSPSALSKPTTTALHLIVTCSVLLGLGFTGWNKLRAEFDESFNNFSALPTVALERTA